MQDPVYDPELSFFLVCPFSFSLRDMDSDCTLDGSDKVLSVPQEVERELILEQHEFVEIEFEVVKPLLVAVPQTAYILAVELHRFEMLVAEHANEAFACGLLKVLNFLFYL